MAAPQKSQATQQFVPVKEIRNGIITLKDGGYRGVLMCSSLNFALKSNDEQRAILEGFQNFLNTLDFSVEIVVHSRKMDIRPYLALLETKESSQKTDLMRLQLREYVEFVRDFTERANIMTKTFYIVVPYASGAGVQVASAIGGIFGGTKASSAATKAPGAFEEDRAQLEQRMALVSSGLSATGLRAIPLGTEEVIELLYRSFNPGEIENPIRLEA
ncbi:MAG: hypothetical protein WDN10_03325 [bacterium]